jgi:putative transposase
MYGLIFISKDHLLMQIHRAYRYELDPNNSQRSSFHRHAGTARFAYNWGLEQRINIFKTNQGKDRFTDAMKQHKLLNSLKKSQFPWMYEVSKCAPQEALRDLHRAFQNFHRKRKNGSGIGFPKFKRKGVKDSFRLTGTIRFVNRKIQLPRIGRIRVKEKRKRYYSGKILSATVSRRANRWFVSVTVEEEIPDPTPVRGPAVGVDLGVKNLATISDGTVIANPRALGRKLNKLRKLSKSLSRKRKGSKNREKAKFKLAKMYLKISNIRQDTLHKVTTHLAKNHSKVVIENLCVSGMLKNRKLARAIGDVGFYEFRRQIEYKCQWYGSYLMVAPRTYPSSNLCPCCGHRKEKLSLTEREYVCDKCGLRIDRDLNAALNLVAVSLPETENACEEEVRLLADSFNLQRATLMKQEPNSSSRREV